MTLRDKPPTPRGSERWERLLFFDVPRWIRVYDNGGRSYDRYTVVYAKTGDSGHMYVGMSRDPFWPTGFGIHGASNTTHPIDWPIYGHLGKKIVYADLPLECQWLVLSDYCEFWHLNVQDHPMYQRLVIGKHGVAWKEGVTPWRAVRPPHGFFDSRAQTQYMAERRMLEDPTRVQDVLLIAAAAKDVPLDVITEWEMADRMDVVQWAASVHLVASDNWVKVSDLPAVLKEYLP